MKGIPDFVIPDGGLYLDTLTDTESTEYGRCGMTYQMLKGKVYVTSYLCVLNGTMVEKGY